MTMTNQPELSLESVAANNSMWIASMKAFARSISARDGKVSSDRLLNAAELFGKPTHPNAWGAIFRNSDAEAGTWVVVGYKQSSKPSRKGGLIRVWAFRAK